MADGKNIFDMIDAEYISDLRGRLMHVPAMYGVDQGDVDRLGTVEFTRPAIATEATSVDPIRVFKLTHGRDIAIDARRIVAIYDNPSGPCLITDAPDMEEGNYNVLVQCDYQEVVQWWRDATT